MTHDTPTKMRPSEFTTSAPLVVNSLGRIFVHVGGQHLCQVRRGYDLLFRSLDDYNFPFSASLLSHFLRFFGDRRGSNFIFHFYNPKKGLLMFEQRITTFKQYAPEYEQVENCSRPNSGTLQTWHKC